MKFNPDFLSHCVIGLAIRLILVVYSNLHDKLFAVPYTDVDYKVFSDAARLVTEGKSPYNRHTYRYSPLLALVLTPNEYLYADFGKVLFSCTDILVTIIIKRILKGHKSADLFAYLWLYNPLSIVISTRGNADSISALLVLATILAVQTKKSILSGLLHGLSIHFRLYPLLFSLSLYLSLRKRNLFIPNKSQIKLILACLLSLSFLTGICYWFYGYQFLYESLIYHLIRKDAKHNFSVYFYMLYLSANVAPSLIEKMLTFLPQLVLLTVTSFKFGRKETLEFGLFVQAMIMVTYNPVMTSQYFFWFLSLLPVALPVIKMRAERCGALIGAWVGAQALWLFWAYMLEFQGRNTFVEIWITGLVFFVVNIQIIVDVCRFVT